MPAGLPVLLAGQTFMPYRPERPVSIAAFWARRLGLFALVLAIVSLILHRLDLLSLSNTVAVILLSAAIAIFVLQLVAVGFSMLWLFGAEGGKASFAGMVMAFLVLGPFGYGLALYLALPPTHDVTTDTRAPPEWLEPPQPERSWLARSAKPDDATRALQREAYPQLTGRRYEGAIDRVLEAVSQLAGDRDWILVDKRGADFLAPDLDRPDGGSDGQGSGGPVAEGRIPVPQARPVSEDEIVTVSSPEVLLQYEWRSPVLGIEHDLLLRLIEEEETTVVDLRAATRVGEHDLGRNAQLVLDFLHDLDIRLSGIAGN